MIRRLRQKLTYANVISSIALFVALGGTSYALTLPRNSVGAKQIRPRAVGASEIRSAAVTGRDVRDGSLGLREISLAARTSLRGQTGPQGSPGPAGPTHRATVNSAGILIRGNPTFLTTRGVNEFLIEFGLTADCVATATLARNEGISGTPPPTGFITVSRERQTMVVRTYDAAGEPVRRAFNIIAAC